MLLRSKTILLVLENEFACNTATGREAGATLAGIQHRNLALNWDPGNAVMRGELDAFPGGWDAIPKERIHHCHVKNAIKDQSGKIIWSPVDKGYVDWAAQFRALQAAGYKDAVNLETHWRGDGTPEASTRTSWAGNEETARRSRLRKFSVGTCANHQRIEGRDSGSARHRRPHRARKCYDESRQLRSCMSQWPRAKAKRVYKALLRIGLDRTPRH